ncbi:MAG: type II toxin-antitoxin system RelE/ParE family toxin [Chitinophagales bacterium]|nr:type II toxin-antitoxin system RelE/ParE family toxin [Chitinophagales bacterium]
MPSKSPLKRKFVIEQKAQDEFEISYRWYLERSAQSADNFRNELLKKFLFIGDYGDTLPIVKNNLRKTSLSVFPFQVIYEITDEQITVYSIFHTSRNPKKKFRK